MKMQKKNIKGWLEQENQLKQKSGGSSKNNDEIKKVLAADRKQWGTPGGNMRYTIWQK